MPAASKACQDHSLSAVSPNFVLLCPVAVAVYHSQNPGGMTAEAWRHHSLEH